MPTIDDLPAAAASSDGDEIMVSQNGATRKVTRAQLLAGTQQQLALSQGALVGRASGGTGAAEPIALGANLTLSGNTLAASASPFVIAQLPGGTVPGPNDEVPISQSGQNVSVSYATFMSGLSGLSGVDASRVTLTPSGSVASVKLADFAANVVARSGALMTGPLQLSADPVLPRQAATKEYVDARILRAGDRMTGPLLLASDPTQSSQAATKQYVDAVASAAVAIGGATMTGALNAPYLSAFQYGSNASDYVLKAQIAGTTPALATGALHSSMEVNHAGGQPGAVRQNAYVDTALYNVYNNGVLVDGPATNQWSLGVLLNTECVESSLSTEQNNGSQHGALYAHAVRYPPQGGLPAGRVGAQTWATWFVMSDMTGLPASQSGAMVANETDIFCNGADDTWSRYGFIVSLNQQNPNGAAAELGRAYYTTTDATSSFKRMLDMAGNYNVSVLDTRTAFATSNAARTIWMTAGQSVAFDYNGNVQLYYDQATDAVHLTAHLAVAYPITTPGLNMTGPAILQAVSAYALPGSSAGAMLYVSNGRKPGEGSGQGTGVVVFEDQTGRWISVLDGRPVSA